MSVWRERLAFFDADTGEQAEDLRTKSRRRLRVDHLVNFRIEFRSVGVDRVVRLSGDIQEFH